MHRFTQVTNMLWRYPPVLIAPLECSHCAELARPRQRSRADVIQGSCTSGAGKRLRPFVYTFYSETAVIRSVHVPDWVLRRVVVVSTWSVNAATVPAEYDESRLPDR